MYVPGEAEGAIPNGAAIIKITFEQGDHNPIGTKGKVLASHGPIDLETGEFGYFVEWDTLPGLPVFVRGRKIEADSKSD